MLTHLVEDADRLGVPRKRLVVLHGNLKRTEWKGTIELVHEQAAFYNLRVMVEENKRFDTWLDIEENGRARQLDAVPATSNEAPVDGL